MNDTVFAGEPLILLNDDDIHARYAAAEAQAGMRRRLRDEQTVTGKALERRRAEDAVAEQETALFDAQGRCGQGRSAMAGERRPGSRPHQRSRGSGPSPGRVGETQGSTPRHRGAACRRRTRRRPHLGARRFGALARVNLEKLKIRAPIDGTVLQININPESLPRLPHINRAVDR